MAGRAPAVPDPNRASAGPPEAHNTSGDELPIEERIRRRAHELYLQRSPDAGSDVDDWLQAERELRSATGESATRPRTSLPEES